jgi:hypothetical protein
MKGWPARSQYALCISSLFIFQIHHRHSALANSILEDRQDEPGSSGRQPDAGLNPVSQVRSAMIHFERAIDSDPSDPNLYRNLMQVSPSAARHETTHKILSAQLTLSLSGTFLRRSTRPLGSLVLCFYGAVSVRSQYIAVSFQSGHDPLWASGSRLLMCPRRDCYTHASSEPFREICHDTPSILRSSSGGGRR